MAEVPGPLQGATATAVPESVAASARQKISRRIIPFVFLLYITSFIDRVNVSFAGLDMTRELHFSNEVFGFGAGIFFVGYSLLEIPGAMLAEVWSSRKWIAAIMMFWGVLAAFTGLIQNAAQFNAIRFFLGLAEGGFFPAVVVYLTHWYRQEDRGKAVAMFMAAIPVANAVGATIAGSLLGLHWLNLAGWRWLLILEGLPAFIGGLITLFYLTDRPKDAHWLTADERNWISGELEREIHEKKSTRRHMGILETLRQPIVLALAISYFLINTSGYGLNIWLPKMVQAFHGLTTMQISLVSAIPYALSIPAMLLVAWHSDRTGERKWHAAWAAIAGGAGLALSQSVGGYAPLVICGFSIASMGIMAYYPTYWALPTRFLSDRQAAASFGFVNLIANFGGFTGPYMVGFLTDKTGTYVAGVLFLVLTGFVSGLILMFLRER
jgi:MFS transporter, ACS family, tartrate transporter